MKTNVGNGPLRNCDLSTATGNGPLHNCDLSIAKPLKPGWFQRGLAAAAREVATWPKHKQEAMQTSSEEGLSVVQVKSCSGCPARRGEWPFAGCAVDPRGLPIDSVAAPSPDWCPLRKGAIRLELAK